MDTLGVLKQVFIFKDVPDPVLQLVAGAAEEMSVSAGESILAPGETPNALYVIGNGTVRVSSNVRDTTPLLFGSGETLGEVPFLDGGPAAINAVALERSSLLVIRSRMLSAVLAGNPEAGHQFYRAIAMSMARRVRRVAGMLAFAREREAKS
jgi:CRP-like cAMP-binding protein